MEQVIDHGITDAMKEIQEARKEMIVLSKKDRVYSQKLNFQAETEAQIDEHTKNIAQKVRELEFKARSLGLNPNWEPVDIITSHLNDPSFAILRQKQVEKESRIAIHRKFHAKIKDLKDELEMKLIQYYEFK